MILNAIIVTMSLLVLLVLLRQLRPLHDFATTFLFVVLWGRYLASSLSEYTLMPIGAGLRIVTLYTLIVLAVSVFFIPLQDFFRRHLLPIYSLFVLAIISGLLNREFAGIIEFLARWSFFVVTALLLYRAFERHGLQRILVIFTITLSSPILVQFISLPLGQGRWQSDGDFAFISGYPSASTFSQVAFTLICISAMIRSRREVASVTMGLIGFISIYLAYYRTVLLGALPIFGMIGFAFVMRNVAPVLRPIIFFIALAGGIIAVPAALQILPERFTAVVDFATNIDMIFEPTIEFSAEDHELGTGRVRLWSNLIQQWRDASMLQHLFGFGAGSLPYSSHGEYTGIFYQLSFPGLMLLLAIFIWQFALMAQIEDRRLALRLMACMTGFMIVCVATSPLWQIEGFVALALICATTWAAVDGALRAEIADEDGGDLLLDRRIGARWINQPTAVRARSEAFHAGSLEKG